MGMSVSLSPDMAPDPLLTPPVHKYRVLIADDDPFATRMLTDRLGGDDVMIVGTASDGDSAVDLTLELVPDLVLMDVSMPGCDGITATERIRARAPEVQIVVLSVNDDPELVLLALRAGAVGFLDKRIEIDALARAVHGIFRGEAALDRMMTRRLIDEFRSVARTRATSHQARSTASAGARLSPRELDVLRLLGAGLGTREISERLGLGVETVRTHVKSILRKLRVSSRRDAVDLAHRRGLLAGAGSSH